MKLLVTYSGSEAQRFAQQPPPFGADWPEVVGIAETIFVYESEPHEPGHHFYQFLACDAEGNEVGAQEVGRMGAMNRTERILEQRTGQSNRGPGDYGAHRPNCQHNLTIATRRVVESP